MSQARVADALARLDEHHLLHLPLRRSDLLGRLALRFLWRRQLKWQVETNLATRDAVRAVSEMTQAQQARLDEAVTVEALHRELGALHRNDQNLLAGLNQRLYSAIGQVQTELGDLRLAFAERTEAAGELEQRIKALEERVAELGSAARDVRARHVRFDLVLDELRRSGPDPAVLSRVPDRDSVLELAVAALLDGPAEQARDARRPYLAVVEEARAAGATGAVLDLAPARGEWWEVLHAAGVPYRSASTNELVRRHCAELGCELADADPLDLLASAPHRSLGAVTAFRYVERQDSDTLARLADLAAAALQPGGVLIVETPVANGTERTWLDPFARRPVHPDFLCYLVEAAGFSHARIPPDLPDGALARGERYCLLAWR